MAVIELDAKQMARVQEWVDGLSPQQKADPDTVLKKYWQGIRKFGYYPYVKPVMEKKATKKAEGEEVDPEHMAWKEYCAWREAQEDKRRGRPRQGFVHPKKIQRG